MSNRFADSTPSADFRGQPLALDVILGAASMHSGDVDEDEAPGAPRGDLEVLDDFGFDDSLLQDDLEVDAVTPEPSRRGRPRVAAKDLPTADADGNPLSVYQRLQDYGLLRKITDIVLAKVAIPWNLRQDAVQEVHSTWATLPARPEFERNQLGRYAYISGQHAALKLRRTLGAVVVIPGACFREGRGSTFMESIGAAVNPRDVDDFHDSLELSVLPDEDLMMSAVSASLFEERMAGLALSDKQLTVARMAILERKTSEEIAAATDTPLMYVERLLNQVTAKLEARDRGVACVRPGKKAGAAATKSARRSVSGAA